MPSIPSLSQGQSAIVTERKQRGLASAFAINLNIFNSKFSSNLNAKYIHVDLNSGSGFNDEVGCIGSPITFLRQVREIGVERYAAFFVDKNKQTVAELLKVREVHDDDRVAVFNGDNAQFIQMIPDLILSVGERPEFAIGTILSDPNGTAVPVDELAWLASKCPRLDLIVNISATAMKRAGKRVESIIGGIPKSNWLIREPIGAWGWTQLIGRNIATSPHTSVGFHSLHSQRGLEISKQSNFTLEERKRGITVDMFWSQSR